MDWFFISGIFFVFWSFVLLTCLQIMYWREIKDYRDHWDNYLQEQNKHDINFQRTLNGEGFAVDAENIAKDWQKVIGDFEAKKQSKKKS